MPKRLKLEDLRAITRPVEGKYFLIEVEGCFAVCYYGHNITDGTQNQVIEVYEGEAAARDLLHYLNNDSRYYFNYVKAQAYVRNKKHNDFLAKATAGWETIEYD